jgi:hypothetical protein
MVEQEIVQFYPMWFFYMLHVIVYRLFFIKNKDVINISGVYFEGLLRPDLPRKLTNGSTSGCMGQAMDKLELTGRKLGRACNSKLRHASVYAMQLHT